MLKGTRFQSRKDIMEKTTVELMSISEEFKKCFQKWQRHWEKCVHLQGEYFEGLNKICDVHCVVCFMAKGWILFGQTLYCTAYIDATGRVQNNLSVL